MRTDLTSIRADLAPMRMQPGQPAPDVSKADCGAAGSAGDKSGSLNDFALTNPTKGEIEALPTRMSTGSRPRTWSLPPA